MQAIQLNLTASNNYCWKFERVGDWGVLPFEEGQGCLLYLVGVSSFHTS